MIPKTVILSESPPNKSIFSWIHFKAKVWSKSPKLTTCKDISTIMKYYKYKIWKIQCKDQIPWPSELAKYPRDPCLLSTVTTTISPTSAISTPLISVMSSLPDSMITITDVRLPRERSLVQIDRYKQFSDTPVIST